MSDNEENKFNKHKRGNIEIKNVSIYKESFEKSIDSEKSINPISKSKNMNKIRSI